MAKILSIDLTLALILTNIHMKSPSTTLLLRSNGFGENLWSRVRTFLDIVWPLKNLSRPSHSPGNSKGLRTRSSPGIIHPAITRLAKQPDTLDFRHYEACRKDFLLYAPHARAAGSNGGILWRLTVESINWDYDIAGPSPEVQQPMMPILFEDDNKTYWVNELQDRDLDIMCGIYKIYSGK